MDSILCDFIWLDEEKWPYIKDVPENKFQGTNIDP